MLPENISWNFSIAIPLEIRFFSGHFLSLSFQSCLKVNPELFRFNWSRRKWPRRNLKIYEYQIDKRALYSHFIYFTIPAVLLLLYLYYCLNHNLFLKTNLLIEMPACCFYTVSIFLNGKKAKFNFPGRIVGIEHDQTNFSTISLQACRTTEARGT